MRSSPSRAWYASRPRAWTAAATCWCSRTPRCARRARRTRRRTGAPRKRRAAPRPRTRTTMALGKSEDILRPARVSTIAASLGIALFLTFLPWPDLRFVPDFVALVLTFWCVRQPRLVGLGIAWTVGLLVDAGNGVLLGQHALAYSLLAFVSIWLSRRVLWFGPMLQALHAAIMLAVAQSLVIVVRIAAGDPSP